MLRLYHIAWRSLRCMACPVRRNRACVAPLGHGCATGRLWGFAGGICPGAGVQGAAPTWCCGAAPHPTRRVRRIRGCRGRPLPPAAYLLPSPAVGEGSG